MKRVGNFMVLLVLGFFLLIPGLCQQVSAEKPITATSIERIELYKTPKKDVISWFGPPAATHQIGDEEVLVYKTAQKDQVTGREFCNLLTVTVNRGGYVTDVVYKKYCELP